MASKGVWWRAVSALSFVTIGPTVSFQNERATARTGARSSGVTVPASWPLRRGITPDQQRRLRGDVVTQVQNCNLTTAVLQPGPNIAPRQRSPLLEEQAFLRTRWA